ncbi:MAG: hypothetical protein AAFR87_20210 [Bacteroidota bacterium]
MKHIILTTVGTSLFTNYQSTPFIESGNNQIGSLTYDLELKYASEYNPHESKVEELEELVSENWFQGIKRVEGRFVRNRENKKAANLAASAEITSLKKIYDKVLQEYPETEVEVQLIASDTLLSVSAAKLIQNFFNQHFQELAPNMTLHFKEKEDYAPDLRVLQKDSELSPSMDSAFEKGIQNFIAMILQNFKGRKGGKVKSESKDHTYVEKWKVKEKEARFAINFSGGYKALIPPLSLIAQIEEWPLFYIYDDSDHLIEFGNFPFQFDRQLIEQFYPYYIRQESFDFSELPDKKMKVNEEVRDLEELCRYKLFRKIDKKYFRTPLGKLLDYYIGRKEALSTNVLGYLMEYKFVDFLREYPWPSRKENDDSPQAFLSFKQGKLLRDITDAKGLERVPDQGIKYARELDIYMENDLGEYIIAEVKSGYMLLARSAEIQNNYVYKQVTEQVEHILKAGLKPVEFHLYIYFYKTTFEHEKQIKLTLNAIKAAIAGLSEEIKFEAFYTAFDLKTGKDQFSSNLNPLQKLSKPISKKKLRKIQLS